MGGGKEREERETITLPSKVAMADSAIHEFQQHLRTHLVMESVTIAR